MNDNVLDFFSRGARWSKTYVSPDGDVTISTSTRGELQITVGTSTSRLHLVDGVSMLTNVSSALDYIFGSKLS